MAEPNKTQPTAADVEEFLNAIDDQQKRADCLAIDGLMRRVTGEAPTLWGPSIVGYGRYRYVYASGRSGESPHTGFSPRKQQLVVYLLGGYEERYASVLARLGPHQTGKSCLYLKRLDDVDEGALRELIDSSVRVQKGERSV